MVSKRHGLALSDGKHAAERTKRHLTPILKTTTLDATPIQNDANLTHFFQKSNASRSVDDELNTRYILYSDREPAL